MDINSLLSPQDTPRATPNRTTNKSARKGRNCRNTKATKSPPKASASTPTSTSAYHAPVSAQRAAPTSSPNKTASGGKASIASTPSFDAAPTFSRQPSTAGMDTLADLASMQHHQQTARANAGGLRSAEIFDSPKAVATSLPTFHNMTSSEVTSRLRAGSIDVTMSDSPKHTPSPRIYFSRALSELELKTITEAGNHILQNPFAYNTYVELINLLHKGLLNHIRLQSSSKTSGDPRSYELLHDLQNTRDGMSTRFAVGESVWADWIQDQILLSTTFEDKLGIRELCERALGEENTSSKLWLIYGQWMLSEHSRVGGREDRSHIRNGQHAQLFPEEERTLAADFFGRQQVLSVWRRGAQETMWRINDSQHLWDVYTDLLLEDMGQHPQSETISSMQHWFMNRLQTPHATWDQTSQKFSTFVSTYDNDNYESIMVTANRLGGAAKQKYDMRDFKEINLLRANQLDNEEAELQAFKEYIDYEVGLSRKKNAFSFELANALFQRATLRFPANTDLWESYAMFLNEEMSRHAEPGVFMTSFLERATRHCPWSGLLWAQYIIAAEIAKMPHPDVEDIKHRATSSGILDAGGLDEVLKVTTAWCGYLRRRAFTPQSTDEEMDVAEVGIRSAIEDLDTMGRKKYGKDYQGDPDYRLEKVYIKYLTQAQKFGDARDTYKRLIPRKGHDYEFWLRYYVFEMITWQKLAYSEKDQDVALLVRPVEATKVLQQALRRTDLDWPEKILQTYLVHCEDHEDAEHLQAATVEFWKQTNALKKRREREAYEQYQYHQQLAQKSQPVEQQEATPNGDGDADHLGKRKREEIGEAPSKKTRPDNIPSTEPQVQEQSLPGPPLVKRDRENATVIVRNLPPGVTELKVRQYFRDCGTINSLKISTGDDGESAVATIEFESKEDVPTAQTKDTSLFDGRTVEVKASSGSTLYVCNFPPTADEAWIRNKFRQYGEIVDIRLPSLKYNTHRRFAYVQFKRPSDAQAAIALDGEKIGDDFELLAKISDPAHKQQRHGATYEGRELFVKNLPWTATWKDLKQLFSEYGSVESARVPRKVNGDSRGIGYVAFRHQEDAQKALALHMTSWKGRTLDVTQSTNDTAKRLASLIESRSPRSTGSPAVTENGYDNRRAPSTRPDIDKKLEIQSRTFALLNVPDTVNDTRIRALTEPFGEIIRILLRPDHQGAIIEYKDQASVGKASLALEGYEIAPGRNLGVGTVEGMKQLKAEKRSDKIHVGQKKNVTALPTPIAVRRPGTGAGRRGGLGVKRVGVGLDGDRTKTTGAERREFQKELGAQEPETGKPKSNADFKAMMLGK